MVNVFRFMGVGVVSRWCAGTANAQTARELTALERAARSAAAVSVVVDGEPAVRGTIQLIAGSAIVVDVDGASRQFALDAVQRVDRDGDSLANGTLIGMAVLGGWCARVCGQGLNSGGEAVLAVLVNAALGGLIGAGIDAGIRGTTTVYRRPSRVEIRPSFTGRAIVLVARF